jgi:hypothetical protein
MNALGLWEDLTVTVICGAQADIQVLLMGGPQLAKMLRLAFHDCTDQVCDGCLDLDNVDNTGLEEPIADLQLIVTWYAKFLTRGDIWVLALYVVLECQQ